MFSCRIQYPISGYLANKKWPLVDAFYTHILKICDVIIDFDSTNILIFNFQGWTQQKNNEHQEYSS